MTQHVLKCEQKYLELILLGEKTFEIRLNDRKFKPGDTVQLYPWDDESKTILPGPQPIYRIGYVCDYAQQAGYVVFSLKALQPI